MSDTNPRAVVGDNRAPDYAKAVTDQMARDYEELTISVNSLLDETRLLPKELADDDDVGRFAALIKRLRDTAARADAFRVAEKEPHLRGGQAVDAFFFGLIDKTERRNRKDRPGAADVLAARLDDYQQRKLRAEQERRQQEAMAAEKAAREAAEKAAAERRAAEEAEAAASRARKAENIAAREVEAKAQQEAAAAARIEADLARQKAESAHIATLAKPADIARTRTDEGALVTMGTEPYAEVEDFDLLDKVKLWPFIHREALEKALRAWAKTTGHAVPMAGARIGKRPKTSVR